MSTTRQDEMDDQQAVRVRLKWFNQPKGFGFVVPEHENTDAFLHITTLQRAGIRKLDENACMLCLIDRSGKGAQVREVLSLLAPDAVTSMPVLPPDNSKYTLVRMTGTVKWYKPEKEFGFVLPDDGQKDIFIHKSCLTQKSLETLDTGARLSMLVKIVAKGREVMEFDII